MFEDDSSSHELIPQPVPAPRSHAAGVTGPAATPAGLPVPDSPLGGPDEAQRGRGVGGGQGSRASAIYQNVSEAGTPPMDGGGEGRARSELDVVQHSQQRPLCECDLSVSMSMSVSASVTSV